jgi:hypothetical protein
VTKKPNKKQEISPKVFFSSSQFEKRRDLIMKMPQQQQKTLDDIWCLVFGF